MKRLAVLILSVVLSAAASAGAAQEPRWYTVSEVLSGDSFRVDGGSVVAYTSLIAPDPMSELKRVEDFGKESLAFNKSLLAGRKVRLEWGARIRDRRGRYLAYVYFDDGTFANRKVLEEGYAKLAVIAPNLEHQEELTKAATKARRDKRGLWAHETERISFVFTGDQMKKIYHYPDCAELDEVAGGHRKTFHSSVEAKAAGFTFCNICKRIPNQNTDLF